MAKAKTKRVYDFDEGDRSMVALLGGKGANLAEMTNTGLPVPHGFTITTATCNEFLVTGEFADGLMDEVAEHLERLQERMGKRLGDDTDPLLVSVRSGAPVSMPGMMETVLNVGLNDTSVKGLAHQTSNERFAFDSYRRLIQMFGAIVMGVERALFEDALLEVKEKKGVINDTDLDAGDLEDVIGRYLEVFRAHTGQDFPQDPVEQMRLAVKAVFDSWRGRKAREYRPIHKVGEDLGADVNIHSLGFGNKGDDSGTRAAFTRDPPPRTQ